LFFLNSSHLYADDIQIYTSCHLNNINSCIATLNENTLKISEWATRNKLSINPNKSQCLVIYKNDLDTSNFPNITINQTNINYVKNSKNLGIVFNSTLSWNEHINKIVGKVYGLLRMLWNTQSFLPMATRAILAKTFLLPILLYGCEIFANCDSVHQNKLRVLSNNIVRYVYCLNRFDHVSTFSIQPYGFSFNKLLQFRVLLYLHKIIYLHEPAYLYEKLQFSRSARNNNLIPTRHKTLISERQFFIHAVRLWNRLPYNLQCTANANQFRKNLEIYLKNQNSE